MIRRVVFVVGWEWALLIVLKALSDGCRAWLSWRSASAVSADAAVEYIRTLK